MTNYTTKSMNGIITIDDGMGTVISGGQISTDNLALASLECNNIQGTNPSDDIFLYTGTTTGTINIGAGATTSTTTIRTDNIEALTGSTINVGRTTDTLSYRGTNKLNNISCILPNSSVNLFTDLNTANLNIATNQNISYRTIIGSLISIVQLINLSFSNNRIISANTNDTITLFDTLASSGKVNIGSTTSETNTGNLTFKNKRISSSLAGDTVNLFDNITSGIINLGGVSSDVRISGRIGIKDTTFTALEGINAGVSLFGNITTGLISIGGGITTGTLNIGTSQTATGTVAIGGVGEVDIGRFRFQNNALKGDISASTLYLFPDFDNNTQTLNIANQLTSTSDPNINIGAPKALTTIGATVFRTVSSVNYIYPSTATAMIIGSSFLSTTTATSLSLVCSANLNLASSTSAINCLGQIIPKYAYNTATGVSNTGAIGYTKYALAFVAGFILSGGVSTRGIITIPVDGVYYISCNQAIFTPSGTATISRVVGYIDIYNGSNVYQTTLGTGCVPSITMPNNVTNFLPFSSIYTVVGATVALPFSFLLRLEPTFTGNLNSSNQNFNFSITRIA